MNTITVDKDELRLTLIKNRDEHKAIYDKAVIAYKEKFVRAAKRFAEDAVERAATGNFVFAQFGWLPVPEEHTEDFDRAIQMLEWEIGDTVELEETDFRQYVQNNWRWAASFASNSTSYIA